MSGVPFLLLIEDDDAIRTGLELGLSRQGHRVVAAATGEDGLKLLKEQRPDKVFLVQFASLVTDPERSMRRLTDRLGLAWDPILLVPTFNGMPIASNSSFSSSMGIDALALAGK